MKYPNTKSWLFFWCSCFNFFNTFIFRCLFWGLILVCSLIVRVLSSITLHAKCLLSFNWCNVFSLFLIAGTIFYDVFNHLSYDAWFFSTEFSVWLCSSSFSCERIWFSIKISIFTWCVCVSCFGYEAVIRTSLDAFSEVRLRWHHRRRNVFKSCCLACIYVNIFCAYVLTRIWFLWCFCFYMSLRKSCGCWFSFRCPRDVSSFGYETMITFFNWNFLQNMYGSDQCTFDVFRRTCNVSTI